MSWLWDWGGRERGRLEGQAQAQEKLDAQRDKFAAQLTEKENEQKDGYKKRIRALDDEKKEIIETFERNKAASKKATREELQEMKDVHDRKIKEVEKAKEAAMKELKEELEELRVKFEEKEEQLHASLDAEKEKRIEEVKDHSKQLNEIQDKRVEDIKASSEDKCALQGLITNLTIEGTNVVTNMSMSHMAGLSNLKESLNIENDVNCLRKKVDSMRSSLTRMNELKVKIDNKKVVNATNKGLFAFVSLSTSNKTEAAQADLLDMGIESTKLRDLCKDARQDVFKMRKNGVDPCLRRKTEDDLDSIQDKSKELYNETVKIRTAMAETGDFVIGDRLAECLDDLERSIDRFFCSMVTQTSLECVERMQAIAETANAEGVRRMQAIVSRDQPIAAIEQPGQDEEEY